MTVRSVQKAIDILLAVAESGGPVTLTETATKARIPVATASRLLHTLTQASLLRRDGKGYTLGIRAFEIGKKAEKGLDLIGVSRPHLRALADRTGENANLAVLDGTDVVYLICEECSRMMRAFTVSGARVSAHATGVGKVLLSGLPDSQISRLYEGVSLPKFTSRTVDSLERLLSEVRLVRQRGYAVDEGEREDGVLCFAAPVRNYSGRVIAAVSISGPTSRLERRKSESRSMTQDSAARISAEMGWDEASGRADR
ncbi:MAG: IclR family transcriptional regulator [Bacillota bacterium]